jgi:hypothetical protein
VFGRHAATMQENASTRVDFPKRGLILQAEFCKPLPFTNLQEDNQERCTHRCIRVEISPPIAKFIAGWPELV